MSTTSQTQAILTALLQAKGRWVSLPELHRVSGAYAVPTRVSNVRKMGHDVQNMTWTGADGKRWSCYRIPAPGFSELSTLPETEELEKAFCHE